MADFFGGILDDLQGVVTDVDSFFESVLGTGGGKKVLNAAALGVKGGYEAGAGTASEGPQRMGLGGLNASVTKGSALTSEDFSAAEAQWIARMKRFAALDTGTDVKLGK